MPRENWAPWCARMSVGHLAPSQYAVMSRGHSILKGLCHGILSYFDHQQNYLEIDGNLKIILNKDGKMPKRIINHKETRMVKDGED